MLVLAMAAIGKVSAEAEQYSFGQAFNIGNAVDISTTKFSPENVGKRYAITGKVTSVCETKHCWMKIAVVHGQDFRIKVDDQVMVFPVSAKGKTIFAEGVLEEWPQPGAPKQSYQLKATSVFIEH